MGAERATIFLSCCAKFIQAIQSNPADSVRGIAVTDSSERSHSAPPVESPGILAAEQVSNRTRNEWKGLPGRERPL